MKFSASVIVLLAVLMSVASAGLMLFLNFDDLFKLAPVVNAEFTSVEFDADDTSYSPAETHSMNQLSKELSLLKDKLLEREKDLDARESALSMDVESLDKQKRELNRIQDDLSSRLAEFESKKGKDRYRFAFAHSPCPQEDHRQADQALCRQYPSRPFPAR